jgi:hypothetical protein
MNVYRFTQCICADSTSNRFHRFIDPSDRLPFQEKQITPEPQPKAGTQFSDPKVVKSIN